MIARQDSRLKGLGSRPSLEHIVLCFWATHFTPTVPVSTQLYKRVQQTMGRPIQVGGEGGGVDVHLMSISSKESPAKRMYIKSGMENLSCKIAVYNVFSREDCLHC